MSKLKEKRTKPDKNKKGWAAVGNAEWLGSFPFIGRQKAILNVKTVIVPAAPGAIAHGSSILLGLNFTGTGKAEGVNLTLSFDQAGVVSKILSNFIASRETAHQATRGVWVNPDGVVRWGTSPQAI